MKFITIILGCLLLVCVITAQRPSKPPNPISTAPPLTQPATKPPTQPATKPPTQPPTQPATKPPTQPATKPPTQPATKPPTQPATKPPTQPPKEDDPHEKDFPKSTAVRTDAEANKLRRIDHRLYMAYRECMLKPNTKKCKCFWNWFDYCYNRPVQYQHPLCPCVAYHCNWWWKK